jgi:hypothetical protein
VNGVGKMIAVFNLPRAFFQNLLKDENFWKILIFYLNEILI